MASFPLIMLRSVMHTCPLSHPPGLTHPRRKERTLRAPLDNFRVLVQRRVLGLRELCPVVERGL